MSKGVFRYMKGKILLLLAASFLVVSCNGKPSSSEPIKPSSSDTSETSEATSSTPSSEQSRESSSSSESKQSSVPTSSSSSSQSSQSSDPGVDEDAYEMQFDSILLKDKEDKNIHLSYKVPREYLSFAHPSTEFKKELAIEAMSFVVAAPDKDVLNGLYQYHSFDDIFYSEDYEQEEDKDTVLFSLAHKKIGNDDLVALTMSGYKYSHQWENNLTIGKTGNHAGFASGAQKVLPTLIQYLAKYNEPKVFVNGYSRTAAIANLITTYLFDNELVDEANYYAYLFETPKGVSASNEKEYNSVFNIVNSADLVTYVAPTEYGLKRIGKDIELYSDKADEIIQAFNPDLQLGEFKPKPLDPETPEDTHYENDVEFLQFFLNLLLEPVPEVPEDQVSRDLSTREHYVDNIQSEISYFIGLYLSLPDEITAELKNKISELSAFGMLGLLGTDGLYNFITPTLDEHEFVYDPEVLKPACNAVGELAQQKIMAVLVFVSDETKGNLMRLIYFHTLEAVLPLLLAL